MLIGSILNIERLPNYWSDSMLELPSGTVTFLFTDIEGSTQLWEH
jgi:class 3 adenylate cyclase